MKTMKRILVATGIAAVVAMIPAEVANAWYYPGVGAWRHAYVHDPAYRWAPPEQKTYIRDLYLRGPGYATWRQPRRWGYWW